MTDTSNDQSGFASTCDQNGDGVIHAVEAGLRKPANDLYAAINEAEASEAWPGAMSAAPHTPF